MTPRGDSADAGFAMLVSQLVEDGRELALAEVDLAKVRTVALVEHYRVPIILFAVAGMLGTAALIALLVGLIFALSPLIGPGLATLVVIGTTLIIAAVAAMIGRARLTRVPKP